MKVLTRGRSTTARGSGVGASVELIRALGR
jgi:hypothetical protein